MKHYPHYSINQFQTRAEIVTGERDEKEVVQTQGHHQPFIIAEFEIFISQLNKSKF